jgi:hypothetical protein
MGFFPSGARWHEPRLCSFDTIELDAAEMKMAIQIQADPGIMGFLTMCFDIQKVILGLISMYKLR